MDDVCRIYVINKETNVCAIIKQRTYLLLVKLSGWWLNWCCLIVAEKDSEASQSDVELEKGQL